MRSGVASLDPVPTKLLRPAAFPFLLWRCSAGPVVPSLLRSSRPDPRRPAPLHFSTPDAAQWRLGLALAAPQHFHLGPAPAGHRHLSPTPAGRR
jgi:hypothetical protein